MTPALARRLEAWIEAVPVSRGSLRDTAGYIHLYRSVFGRDIQPSYMQWRYGEDRSPGEFFVVPGETTPAGVWGHDLLALHGTPPVSAAFAIDLMLDPSRQRTGVVFGRLARTSEAMVRSRGAKVWYSFPNARGCAALVDFCGHREVERIPLLSSPTRRTKGKLHAERVEDFGSWIGEIDDGFRALYPDLIWVPRSADRLMWRFRDNPSHDYDLIRVRDDQTLVGYVVTKTFRDASSGEVTGDIVDLAWTRDGIESVQELLATALDNLHDRGAPIAVGWFRANTLLGPAAARSGFTPTSTERSFLVKVLDPDFEWLGDPSRWYLTLSDSELY